MNIGIYDINTSSNLNYKERLDIYKEAGFKEIGLYLDDNYMSNNEKYSDIIEYAKSIDLEIKQVHLDYKISNLICSKDSNEYFDYLENKIKESIRYSIPLLVVHASKGDNPPLIDSINLNKLKDLANKYPNTVICFENVRVNDNLEKILNLNIKNLKMCYDLGHAHCYNNEFDLLTKYKDNIICAHLHNNTGNDSHFKLSEGDIDYKRIIEFLKETNVISSCLECFPPRGVTLDKSSFKEFIISCYNDIK